MWHDFRIIHRMYSKWDALRQESDDVVLDPKKDICDKYIPLPPPKSKAGSGGAGSGATGSKRKGNVKARGDAAP